jgi:mannose PTS system EIIA component
VKITGALVVTHGKLGEVLVEEVEHLVGRQEQFSGMSTLGMSAGEITDKVRSMIADEPFIVFTDTPGTSPTIRSSAAIDNGQAVISGVNIGMLISFIMYRETIEFQELAERMVRDGRRCVEVKWSRNQ